MNETEISRKLKREFSTPGWALLIYTSIVSSAVTAAIAIDVALRLVRSGLSDNITEDILKETVSAALGNGWGYIATILICFAVLLIWKKPAFCFKTIWKKEKPITAGAFFSLAAIFIGVQAVAQVLVSVMEQFVNTFGLSIMKSMEAATTIEDTVSMFLYAAILAPIWEEVVFRGVVMRSLERYGRKFAIFASAFLFGVFHGNIVQTPYAFMVGLVLGYVAMEYSMLWSIVLHMLNNLVLADMMSRLADYLPAGVGNLISGFIIWSCAIAATIILIVRRRDVAAYLRTKKMHPMCVKNFFTAPGVIVFSCVMLGEILLVFLNQ